MFEYGEKVRALLNRVDETQSENITTLANKIVENIENDKIIHTFGTGHSHMIGIEIFARAGGLGNVNAILDPDTLTAFGAQRSGRMEKVSGVSDVIFDSYKIVKGDIMIVSSNSGRNAMPIEMAMRCQKEGVYVVALTNVEQSKKAISRHASGKRLFECADLVLDSCVADGDAEMNIDGVLVGPGSSMASMYILNCATTEAMKICNKKGIKYPVFQSQNVDGFDNDSIYNKYESRVKHY